MIIYGFQVFNFTLVFLSLLIIAIFATLMYQGVELLEKMDERKNIKRPVRKRRVFVSMIEIRHLLSAFSGLSEAPNLS